MSACLIPQLSIGSVNLLPYCTNRTPCETGQKKLTLVVNKNLNLLPTNIIPSSTLYANIERSLLPLRPREDTVATPSIVPFCPQFWGARRLETTVCGSHPRALRARVTGVGMCKQKISTALEQSTTTFIYTPPPPPAPSSSRSIPSAGWAACICSRR